MRLADYVAETLAQHGIRDVFLVTGGNAMHLNDAIGRHPRLKHLCFHHEQACTLAAESYYRLTNRLAAVNVTSGPGATNAITGVFGAWSDSLGMIVISGQPKWETLVKSTGLPLRQLGDQEVDIVAMVKPITKYAVMIEDPQTIRYHLERAIYLASHGRPGPCWVDIPMNIQGTSIDPDTLKGYNPEEDVIPFPSKEALENDCRLTLEKLHSAKRPVILAGCGIRLSGHYDRFLACIDKLGIPVATAWNAHDLLWDEHPLFAGKPGTVGDRPGNFSVQNADVLLVLGCRLNIRQVGYNWQSFAKNAFKIIVDIDPLELKKPTIRPDLAIHADAGAFMGKILEASWPEPPTTHGNWLNWCQERRRKYPVVLPEYHQKPEPINPYCFAEALWRQLPENEIVVTGDATAAVVTFQTAGLKKGQRLYSSSGSAPMGYDLPAAIGACIGSGRNRVICLAGDGSIMMNIQELQTIAGNALPIKIFLLNNQGYLSIRLTQQNYFSDNVMGCDPAHGVTFPTFSTLAAAHGLAYCSCSNEDNLPAVIDQFLSDSTPGICEVFLDPAQPFAPKAASKRLPDGSMVSAPLEDMAPFLSREELLENTVSD